MLQLIEYKLTHHTLPTRFVYSQSKCEQLEQNGYDLIGHKVIKRVFDYKTLNPIHQTV